MSKITAFKCDNCDTVMEAGQGFTFIGIVNRVGQGGVIGNGSATQQEIDYCIKCAHEIMFKPLGISMSQSRDKW